MLGSYSEWTEAIGKIEVIPMNPVVGLALDEQEAQVMQNCVANTFHTTTTRQLDGPYIVIRACRQFTYRAEAEARAMLYGIHYTRT
jgi:hypothetical protein